MISTDVSVSKQPSDPDRVLMLLEETAGSLPSVDLNVLHASGGLAHHVTEITTYKNQEKTVHLVAWVSEAAAVGFSSSAHVAGFSSVLCVRLMRDYGRTHRREAPV